MTDPSQGILVGCPDPVKEWKSGRKACDLQLCGGNDMSEMGKSWASVCEHREHTGHIPSIIVLDKEKTN